MNKASFGLCYFQSMQHTTSETSLVGIQKERKTELNSTPSGIYNPSYIMLFLCSKNLGWLPSCFPQVGPNLHLQPHVSLSWLQHAVCSRPVEQLAILWIFHIFWLFYASLPSVEGVLPPSLLLVKLLSILTLNLYKTHHLQFLLYGYIPLLNYMFFETSILHLPRHLEQCLVHDGQSTNVCWINNSNSESG